MIRSMIYGLDLAERKEICLRLLGWLSAEQQKRFLDWCISQLPAKYRDSTRLDGPIQGGCNESWHWLCILCTQYDLDFATARAELLRRVRATSPVKHALRSMRLLAR